MNYSIYLSYHISVEDFREQLDPHYKDADTRSEYVFSSEGTRSFSSPSHIRESMAPFGSRNHSSIASYASYCWEMRIKPHIDWQRSYF